MGMIFWFVIMFVIFFLSELISLVLKLAAAGKLNKRSRLYRYIQS